MLDVADANDTYRLAGLLELYDFITIKYKEFWQLMFFSMSVNHVFTP